MSKDAPAPQPKRPYKRRILLINKNLQYRFVFLIMAFVAVAVAFFTVGIFMALEDHIATAAPSVDLSEAFLDAKIAMAIWSVVYLAGVFAVCLVVSHRIAGPLYRFERSAEQVAAGDLTLQVHLRKGDGLFDYKDAFNAMLESLHQKVSADAARADRVKKVLEALATDTSLAPPAAERARQAINDIAQIGKGFKI